MQLETICNFLFGEFTEIHKRLYSQSKEFKDYIDFCFMKIDDKDWTTLYDYKNCIYMPTFYFLDNTNYVINNVKVLKFYSLYDTIFIEGTNSNIYLKKTLKTDEDFENFASLLTVPFTPKLVKNFESHGIIYR